MKTSKISELFNWKSDLISHILEEFFSLDCIFIWNYVWLQFSKNVWKNFQLKVEFGENPKDEQISESNLLDKSFENGYEVLCHVNKWQSLAHKFIIH